MLLTWHFNGDWVILINLEVVEKSTKVSWVTILSVQTVETCLCHIIIRAGYREPYSTRQVGNAGFLNDCLCQIKDSGTNKAIQSLCTKSVFDMIPYC